MGWLSIITVDGIPYQINGQISPGLITADQVAISLTPTRTSVLLKAGPVTVNVTYLSPVEVSILLHLDLKKHSDALSSAKRPRSTIVAVLLLLFIHYVRLHACDQGL